MQNERPMDEDPQTIWRSQITEEIKMSLTQFRNKAEQRRARFRWIVIANDLTYIAALLILGFIYANTPDTTSRVGLALMAVGLSYVVYRGHKQLWPLSEATDGPPATGLETYRRELQRWRDHLRYTWRMVIPLIPGWIVFALPHIAPLIRQMLRDPGIFLINALPVSVLFAIWLTLIFPVQRRRVRKIQQEIDTLDRLIHSSPEQQLIDGH
jgi:hypothetical protein